MGLNVYGLERMLHNLGRRGGCLLLETKRPVLDLKSIGNNQEKGLDYNDKIHNWIVWIN